MHLASPSRVLLGLLAGKSLKTLMSKGILQVHPPICDCPGCRISSPVVRYEISWSLLGRRAGFLLQKWWLCCLGMNILTSTLRKVNRSVGSLALSQTVPGKEKESRCKFPGWIQGELLFKNYFALCVCVFHACLVPMKPERLWS